MVTVPSFIVRLDSQKHIDFSLQSPFGGGRPGRVKRRNAKKGKEEPAGGDDDAEADEEWSIRVLIFFHKKISFCRFLPLQFGDVKEPENY